MANKTIPTSNGVNLVVDGSGKVVEAFTKSNNTSTYLPSNDPKVTTAVNNLKNSPSLLNALNVNSNNVAISGNYTQKNNNNTAPPEPGKSPQTTTNQPKDPVYGPIFSGSGGSTKALVYPLSLSKDQDRMVITMYRYRNTLNAFIDDAVPGGLPGGRDITKVDEGDGKPLAYIVLPMPNNIGDISKVEWNASVLPVSEIINSSASIIRNLGAAAASPILSGRGQRFNNVQGRIPNAPNQGTDSKNQGIINEGLISRFGGIITNPNQDLLFSGNGLREFSYSFDLYPRNKAESEEIRKIVRTFRQGMLPRKIFGGVLVGAPNVFRIRFIKGGTDNEPLKDVRRHKELALTQFVADPTPGDVWMTHNDNDHSTIGFKISMEFTELVPIYYNDFVDDQGKDIRDINGDSIEGSIGY